MTPGEHILMDGGDSVIMVIITIIITITIIIHRIIHLPISKEGAPDLLGIEDFREEAAAAVLQEEAGGP